MRSVIFIIALLWAEGFCTAKTIYVDVGGPNDPGTGSYEDPFRRIQDAINSADNNDTVIIAEGVYTTDPNNRNLDFDGKAITVCSTDPNDPNVVAATVIDPNEAGRAFYFRGAEDANSVLSGLTMTNGYADNGGGISCLFSSPKITNCVIRGNATDYGGGIACLGSSPTIINCIIRDNSADYGGGIACDSSSPTIINCTITANDANDNGGGIYCYRDSNPKIINTILWDNTAAQGNEIALCSESNPSAITVGYSDVEGGTAQVYTESGCTLDWEQGNIDAEPEFVDSSASDPSQRDYHLHAYSPCINAGNPLDSYNNQTDIDGEPRILYCRVDIGADEAFPILGDFEPDGDVDMADLSIITGHWLENGAGIQGDIYADESVDFLDFAVLIRNWVPACP